MAKALHSDHLIARLTVGERKRRVAVSSHTGSGLSVVVFPSGRKAFVARYRLGGSSFDVQLGDFGVMTLAEARVRHAEGAKLIAEGRDPRLVWSEAYRANVEAQTCDSYFKEWIAHYAATPRPKTKRPPAQKTVADHQARWTRALSWLHAIPIKEVARDRVTREIKSLAIRAPTDARLSLQLLSLLFAAAEDDGLIDVSPISGIKAAKLGAISQQRDRILSFDELRALWHGISGITGHAIRLLILTGARRAEVAEMHWAEVDLGRAEWHLPAERTKSRREFKIYFGPRARQLLTELRQFGCGGYVFPGQDGERSLHPDSLDTALTRYRKSSNCRHFTLHDLRRTAATYWHCHCGADIETADAMLNHGVAGVASVYIIERDRKRQQEIWLRWDALVAEIVAPMDEG